MDCWSCVLVPRNKEWFNAALPEFQNLWNIILKERENREFEKRKPKKREQKKKPTISFDIDDIKLNNNMKQLFSNLPDTPKVIQGTPIVKIRTQSFDEVKKN